LKDCVIGTHSCDSKTTDPPDANGIRHWTATFNSLKDIGCGTFNLIATGNTGGSDCIPITIDCPASGAPGIKAGDTCVAVSRTCPSQPNAPGWKDMIRDLKFQRVSTTFPGGYAFRLTFSRIGTAHFILGGTLPPGDNVHKCSTGAHKPESMLSENGEWHAVFNKVPDGPHVFVANTKDGLKDEVRILIENKP
jgi:hypothetical protein